MGRLKLLLLLLLIPITAHAQGAGTAASIYRTTFANLGSPANGSVRYVTDGTPNTTPCTGGGSGAFAERVNGVWSCSTASAIPAPTPGGSNTQVQYNNAGAFGGITGATSNGTALTLVAPVLGTPASGTLTNTTGFPIANLANAGTNVLTALGVNVGSAGAFVVNGGALGSPSSVGTMPAFTLGGTVSGGGNQINNVIIGTSTPLGGFFNALTLTGVFTQTVSSATAHEIGPNGGTNPVLRVITNVASQADGISISGGAAGVGTTIAALSSGSNSPIILMPKGTSGVGIGRTPSYAGLDVYGVPTAGSASLLNVESSDTSKDVVFYLRTGATPVVAQLIANVTGGTGSAVIFGSSSNHRLIVRTNNADVAAFTTGGNLNLVSGFLGFGSATAPTSNLSQQSAGIVQFGTTAANALGSWLATNGTLSGTLKTPSFTATADSVTAFQFFKNNGSTVVADIDTTNSRVGILNSAPVAALHVGAGTDTPTTGSTLIYATAAGTSAITVRDSTNDVENTLYVDSGGGVIGTVTNHSLAIRTNNTAAITISNAQAITLAAPPSAGAGATYMCLSTANVINVGVTCAASYEGQGLKLNLEDVKEAQALEWIRAIRPKEFDWNPDPQISGKDRAGRHDIGFSANQLDSVSPLFSVRQNGEVFSVNDRGVLSLNTTVLKNVDARVTQLEAIVAQQQKQIEVLMARQ